MNDSLVHWAPVFTTVLAVAGGVWRLSQVLAQLQGAISNLNEKILKMDNHPERLENLSVRVSKLEENVSELGDWVIHREQ